MNAENLFPITSYPPFSFRITFLPPPPSDLHIFGTPTPWHCYTKTAVTLQFKSSAHSPHHGLLPLERRYCSFFKNPRYIEKQTQINPIFACNSRLTNIKNEFHCVSKSGYIAKTHFHYVPNSKFRYITKTHFCHVSRF